jgi:hypothetical protein
MYLERKASVFCRLLFLTDDGSISCFVSGEACATAPISRAGLGIGRGAFASLHLKREELEPFPDKYRARHIRKRR